MSLADDLAALDQLHQRGGLTDAEFAHAKARLLGHGPALSPRVGAMNGLRRSVHDHWFGGVCGGLGRATGMESWLWRLFFTLFLLAGGISILVYLALWIFVPSESGPPPLVLPSQHE